MLRVEYGVWSKRSRYEVRLIKLAVHVPRYVLPQLSRVMQDRWEWAWLYEEYRISLGKLKNPIPFPNMLVDICC